MKTFLALAACAFLGALHAQITVQDSVLPYDLVAQHFLTNGIFISNATVNGSSDLETDMVGTFNSENGNIGLPQGILLTTGDVNGAVGPNNVGGYTGMGEAFSVSDPDLDSILAPDLSFQYATVEFDFIATADSMNFTYVFASEEYPEYVNSFNDGFGFFISGPGIEGPFSNGGVNIALIPGTDVPVTINNVNNGNDGLNGPCVNCEYYIHNGTGGDPEWDPNNEPYWDDETLTQYDGFTVPLTAAIGGLEIGQTYHIKLGVSDANDSALDSAVFLKDASFELICSGDDEENIAGDASDRGSSFPCQLCTIDFSSYVSECNGEMVLTNESEILIPWDYAEFVINDVTYPVSDEELTINGLEAGLYEVVLNVYSGEFVATVSDELLLGYETLETYAALILTTTDNCTGSATIQLAEDENLYLFSWDGADYTGFNSIDGLCVGPHNVKVWSEELCSFGDFDFEIEPTVGIDEEFGSAFQVFPNPAQDHLFFEGLSQDERVEITIYDLQGKLLFSKSLQAGVLDISSLARGAYVLDVRTSSASVRRHFVKQ